MRVASHDRDTPDPDLMVRVAAGDLSALGVLFDRYHGAVRSVVLHAGTPRADADDVVQDTFLRLIDTASRFDGRATARPWILGMAWRVSSERRRSLGRWLRAVGSFAHATPGEMARTPEQEHASSEAWRCFCEQVSALPEKMRAAYVLVEVHGLSGEEAALALAIPVATVWTRLHHARKKLVAAGAVAGAEGGTP